MLLAFWQTPAINRASLLATDVVVEVRKAESI